MKLTYTTGRVFPLDSLEILTSIGHEPQVVFLETSRVYGEENSSYLFIQPLDTIDVYSIDDVAPLFKKIDKALKQGLYVAGWWSYEFGYLLEPRLYPLLKNLEISDRPLAQISIFKRPMIWNHEPSGPSSPLVVHSHLHEQLSGFELDVSRSHYLKAIEKIKDYISSGHTYQVNYTARVNFEFSGDPVQLYLALRAQQPVSYGALIRNEDDWIISLSPELFFRIESGRIWSKPMKGTLGRGRTVEEDIDLARFLSRDIKNRAENVMIVDLIRNDLGRLCTTGSVTVPELFTVERYNTLFQMISRVEGTLKKNTSWLDIFRSLFPCGSVTGAPKIRTMEIIRELEVSPRGVYTGAIGFISPEGKSVFNVAIRTVELSKGKGTMGIGSGITIGSDPEAEYEECILKAEFLTRPFEDFHLIETILWEKKKRPETGLEGYFLLSRHLERLEKSAHYFSFHFDHEFLIQKLRLLVRKLDMDEHPKRVRLLLARDGSVETEFSPLNQVEEPVPIGLSKKKVASTDPFRYHKTTRRALLDEEHRIATERGLFDVIFINERGEITEGAITNIFIRRDGKLITPPLSSGLLPGTLRQELIETGKAAEKVIHANDLKEASEIYVGNSVRGLLRARYRS